MPTQFEPIDVEGVQAIDLACESLYRYLAAAVSDSRDPKFSLVFDRDAQWLAVESANLLRGEFAGRANRLGFGEQAAEDLDLGPAVDIVRADPDAVRAEYTKVFGLITCRECPPYETEFHPNEDTFFRTQQMADIAGFYRAFGIEPSHEFGERPDHLAIELEFMAYLLLRKRMGAPSDSEGKEAGICDAARLAFFRDHLIWWATSFAIALRRKAEDGFLCEIGKALGAFLAIDRQRLGLEPPTIPIEPRLVEGRDDGEGCLVQIKV
ncbi:MAG: molecular chaperone TorD family protein [Planctomycetes bacterium]|nr:molecular chaperone TorD family protein [Planctomycetota bacterium]